MKREFVLLRKAAIVIVAAASVAGAVGLMGLLDLTSLSILQMLAMLALILLPLATYFAWQWDRRVLHDRIPSDHDNLFETPEGIDFAEEPIDPKPLPQDLARTDIPGRTMPDSPQAHRRRRQVTRHPAERD